MGRRKTLAPVVRHAGGPEHERLDQILQSAARNLFTEWLRFAEAAQDFIAESYWVRFKFPTPEAYFEQRLGLSYRTVRRWCSIVEGLRRLPKPEATEAQKMLVGLGSHKAGVLAPVLGRPGQDWRAWVMAAQSTPEETLQTRVSEVLGHRPRGPSIAPGETWYRRLLGPPLPDDIAEEAKEVFAYGEHVAETKNPIDIFRHMLADVKVEWSHQAMAKDRS